MCLIIIKDSTVHVVNLGATDPKDSAPNSMPTWTEMLLAIGYFLLPGFRN